MKVFGDHRSGNCLKVEYTADYLGIPYEWAEVDILGGQSRTPDFLSMNPHGQVPVIELDDGRHLAQSNAIIQYLAEGSSLLPHDPFERSKVNEWLFWEQYSHEPYIAVCRFHVLYLNKPVESREQWRVDRGEAALDAMEERLAAAEWIASTRFSIADIALLAYTRLAGEGGFSIAARPGIRRWISDSETVLGL